MSYEGSDPPAAFLAVAADSFGDGGTATGRRVTRRRRQTRERLMEAGFEVFAERGLSATIEEICERAGYTRGAFYSNFRTTEELFFALYERLATTTLARARAAVSGVRDSTGKAKRAGDIVGAAVEEFLSVAMSPDDRSWWLLTSEYALHAARDPHSAQRLAVLRKRLQDELDRFIVSALDQAGLSATIAPEKLSRVLAAVHAGALAQSFEDPDGPTYQELLRLAMPFVIRGLTAPRGDG
jgi:AcrR family transcriptional regulator